MMFISLFQFQFDEIDKNQDGLLQKPEVDGILTHVPHEDCMFGFMISSDVNGDHMLSRQELYASFKYVGKYRQTLPRNFQPLFLFLISCILCM